MNAFFIIDTQKSIDGACTDLDGAVVNHGFGLLPVHDLGETLRSKGIVFSESDRVFEVCNPKQAGLVLERNYLLNTALPCRISVYTDAGQTRVGMVRPAAMIQALSTDPQLIDVVQQVDASTSAMINEPGLLTEHRSEEVLGNDDHEL